MLCISHRNVWFLEIAQIQWMRKGLLTQGKQCMHFSYGAAFGARVFFRPAGEPPGKRRRVSQGWGGGNPVGVLALCWALWRVGRRQNISILCSPCCYDGFIYEIIFSIFKHGN